MNKYQFLDEINAFRKAANTLSGVTNWVDVNDRLPQKQTEVLVWVGYDDAAGCEIAYLFNSEWVSCMRGVGPMDIPVTHWQPLSKGPGEA